MGILIVFSNTIAIGIDGGEEIKCEKCPKRFDEQCFFTWTQNDPVGTVAEGDCLNKRIVIDDTIRFFFLIRCGTRSDVDRNSVRKNFPGSSLQLRVERVGSRFQESVAECGILPCLQELPVACQDPGI